MIIFLKLIKSLQLPKNEPKIIKVKMKLLDDYVDEEFSKRLTYVAIANRPKDNDKEVDLIVLSTAEESKIIEYKFNKNSVFKYRVVNLKD